MRASPLLSFLPFRGETVTSVGAICIGIGYTHSWHTYRVGAVFASIRVWDGVSFCILAWDPTAMAHHGNDDDQPRIRGPDRSVLSRSPS